MDCIKFHCLLQCRIQISTRLHFIVCVANNRFYPVTYLDGITEIMSIAGAIIFAITFILMIFGKVNYNSRGEQKHIESIILQMLLYDRMLLRNFILQQGPVKLSKKI